MRAAPMSATLIALLDVVPAVELASPVAVLGVPLYIWRSRDSKEDEGEKTESQLWDLGGVKGNCRIKRFHNWTDSS